MPMLHHMASGFSDPYEFGLGSPTECFLITISVVVTIDRCPGDNGYNTKQVVRLV